MAWFDIPPLRLRTISRPAGRTPQPVDLYTSGSRPLKLLCLRQIDTPAFTAHMLGPGVIHHRHRGISGGHGRADFDRALAGQGTILEDVPVRGLEGARRVRYKLFKVENGVLGTTLSQGDPFTKTTFDPAIWTIPKLAQLGWQVFGNSREDGIHVVHCHGVTYIGWIRDGKLQSFGVQ